MNHLKRIIVYILAAVIMLSTTGFSVPVLNEEDTPKPAAENNKSQEPAEKNGDIYILFTSDVHCGINEGFGYAGLCQIRDTLEAQGYETILVDNGDSGQP